MATSELELLIMRRPPRPGVWRRWGQCPPWSRPPSASACRPSSSRMRCPPWIRSRPRSWRDTSWRGLRGTNFIFRSLCSASFRLRNDSQASSGLQNRAVAHMLVGRQCCCTTVKCAQRNASLVLRANRQVCRAQAERLPADCWLTLDNGALARRGEISYGAALALRLALLLRGGRGA